MLFVAEFFHSSIMFSRSIHVVEVKDVYQMCPAHISGLFSILARASILLLYQQDGGNKTLPWTFTLLIINSWARSSGSRK